MPEKTISQWLDMKQTDVIIDIERRLYRLKPDIPERNEDIDEIFNKLTQAANEIITSDAADLTVSDVGRKDPYFIVMMTTLNHALFNLERLHGK